MSQPKLGSKERKILELLQNAAEPLTEGEMRLLLGESAESSVQFGRRRRELNKYFVIEKVRLGKSTAYRYVGPKSRPRLNTIISKKLRVQILTRDGGFCQICGRSPRTHPGVTIEVDHKIPGGPNTEDNLWALCHDCNNGKKDLFESYGLDPITLAKVLVHKEVHVRIGELLKLFAGKPTPSFLLFLVAGQDDWKKRLRELRYLGWEITSTRSGKMGGRVQVAYTLVHAEPWPPNPTKLIRDIEKRRHDEKIV